jgi:hypothetical protein
MVKSPPSPSVPHLASDSRFSFGQMGHIDFGIKVFSVPVKIYAPTTGGVTELYKSFTIGMCVAGSTTNAYIVKEAIYEILQYLQFAPPYTECSMIGICEVVKKVFQKTSQDICAILRDSGISGIIITGNCPEQDKFRTFKFTLDTSNYPIQAEYSEILEEDGIEFMGSGSEIAKEFYDKNPTWHSLKIIKETINSNRDTSVGGGLQYGEYNINKDFIIRGVQDYEIDNDGYPQYKLMLRGVEIYKDEFEANDSDFHIAYPFLAPFQNEINEIWKAKGIE